MGFVSSSSCSQVFIRGFNIAKAVNEFQVTWKDAAQKATSKKYKAQSVDPDWGQKNGRSYLMGQATIETDWKCSDLCPSCEITYYAFYGGIQSYHPFYGYLPQQHLLEMRQ